MKIVKAGKPGGEFHFKCRKCGCEWYAERKEVSFTPPFMEYAVYMRCPSCGNPYVKESEEEE